MTPPAPPSRKGGPQPGAGRPATTGTSDAQGGRPVRVSAVTWSGIDELATAWGVSRVEALRRVVEAAWLAEHGDRVAGLVRGETATRGG